MTPPVVEAAYVCKACGRPVVVAVNGAKIWTCEHRGGTVIANMAAQVTAHSTTG